MFRKSLLLIFILSLSYTDSAVAQESISSTDYQDLLNQALAEYDEGRWERARTLFRGAHEINPTARTLRGLGLASFRLIDYVSSIKYLKEALNETHRPLTEEQRKQAQEIITRASDFVGRLIVALKPPDAHLSVDGVAKKLEGNDELLTNPGRIELVVEAKGYKTLQRNIDVESGRKRVVKLTLEPISDATQHSESPIQSSEQIVPKVERESSVSLVPYVVMGFGGALLIGSAITGIITYAAESELVEVCDADNYCPPEHESTIEMKDTLQVLSMVLLGTGLAASATGLVLLLTADSDQELSSTSNVSLRCCTDGCLGVLSSVF